MVQFTPTYFSKRGGFVINQLSGGGCAHMGNFPTVPLPGRLDVSPGNILDHRVDISAERGHARLLRGHRGGAHRSAAHGDRTDGHGPLHLPRGGRVRHGHHRRRNRRHADRTGGRGRHGVPRAARDTPKEATSAVSAPPTRSTSWPSSTLRPPRRASGRTTRSRRAAVSPRAARRAFTSPSTSARAATSSTGSASRTSRWRTPARISGPRTTRGTSPPCGAPPKRPGTAAWG